MIYVNNEEFEYSYFPDKTLKMEYNLQCEDDDIVTILWKFENNEEMIILYYLVKHIREINKYSNIILYLPYIPNARMDRVETNEIFTLKYFADFINFLSFKEVLISDPHSSVATALLNNVHNISHARYYVKNLTQRLLKPDDIVFFPDEGACKRYSKYFVGANVDKILFGIKNRDWKTGKIKSLDIIGETNLQKGFNALIVDDICSYGGTFLHSARKLKEIGADKIWLYVTHCENSILDGELIKSGLLEKIYTTNTIFTKKHELIEVIK